MASTIYTFTGKGSKSAGLLRRGGVRVSPLGKFDPNTGLTWQYPRYTNNRIKGSSVRVTNPRAADPVQAQRTQSIGMGAAGQQKRNM